MLARTTANDATEAATADELEKKIPAKVLKDYLKAARTCTGEIDTIRDKLGKATGKLSEKYTVNSKMLGWIKQLDKMPAEKLADNLADLEYMLDVSGLNDRAKSAQRLPIEEAGGEE